MKTIKVSAAILITIVLLPDYGCKKKETNDPVIETISEQRGYKNLYSDSFRCGLFVPPSYDFRKSYPLIIFLHGYTDTTSWDLPWYNDPVVANDPCIVMTPKCPAEEIYGWGDSWDSRLSPMIQKTFKMLDLVKEALSLDYDRFYIYGSSMGATGTYGLLQKFPDMFAAAYVECGAVNPEIADALVNIPLWIFHGSDDETVPVSYARTIYQRVLDAGGSRIRYTEYEGVGHNVWDYTRNETTLNSWLLAQRKGVTHESPDTLSQISAIVDDQNHVILNWQFPADISRSGNQIWFVRIYRDGKLLGEVYNNIQTGTDSSTTEGNIYRYELSAVNYFFKESRHSTNMEVAIP